VSAPTAYAFTLGLVALLNPCGFPLLPAYLALFVGDGERAFRRRLLGGVRAGACLTAGFLIVFGVLGLVADAVMSVVLGVVPWLMIAVGLGLCAFGVAGLLGRTPIRQTRADWLFRGGASPVSMIGFGAAYAVGSLSCSLPLFLAGLASALSAEAPLQGIAAFLAYALGMGLFVTAASLVASLAGAGAVRGLRSAARVLPRAAGAVCLLAGVYLLVYWIHELVAPAANVPLIAGAQQVQALLAGWLNAAALPFAAGCALLVVLALVVLAATARKEPSR